MLAYYLSLDRNDRKDRSAEKLGLLLLFTHLLHLVLQKMLLVKGFDCSTSFYNGLLVTPVNPVSGHPLC